MRSDLLRCVVIAGSILFLVSVARAQDVTTDEDAPRLTPGQRLQIYQLNQEIRMRTDASTRNDPRYVRYLADFEQLTKQRKDRSFRDNAIAFRKKHSGLQNDILRKSGVDRRAYNLRLKKILPQIQLDSAGNIINPKPGRIRGVEPRATNRFEDTVFRPASFAYRPRDDNFETTDFSKAWSYKDCSQAGVEFGSSDEFNIFAYTGVSNDDCDDVKGARGTVIDVPAGVKRVRVEITLDKYTLSTDVLTPLLFSYGNSYAAVGIRVNGWILGSAKKTNYFRHKYLDTVWSVVGGDAADIEESGEVILKCSFRPLVPGEYRVQSYGRVWVTTDGFASSGGWVTVEGLEKIKVTFVR